MKSIRQKNVNNRPSFNKSGFCEASAYVGYDMELRICKNKSRYKKDLDDVYED